MEEDTGKEKQKVLNKSPEAWAIILTDLKNAGIKEVIMNTDHGNEFIRNLDMYIEKGQPLIMEKKVGQKQVGKIYNFGSFDHHKKDMKIDPEK